MNAILVRMLSCIAASLFALASCDKPTAGQGIYTSDQITITDITKKDDDTYHIEFTALPESMYYCSGVIIEKQDADGNIPVTFTRTRIGSEVKAVSSFKVDSTLLHKNNIKPKLVIMSADKN